MDTETEQIKDFSEDIGFTTYLNESLHPYKHRKEIAAYVVVSESEISKVIENYDSTWPVNNPDGFYQAMHELGCDTRYECEVQDNLLHRNRLNEVVVCRRWVWYERTDPDWLKSGYASREAIHKASGNRLLRDMNKFAYVQD